MKIAFLGKGGSGKSTMSIAFVRKLRERGYNVLAIDADHNMDLSYGLGAEPSLFLGSDPERIKEHVGAERSDTYLDTLKTAQENGTVFTIEPADEYTASVSIKLEEGLRLMTAGPHTERVRSQEACSHSLAAPLKVYLPLLRLNPYEAVVIDERAGTDPVATGILSAVDLAVIVREPTINSTRVAEQIKCELEIARIAHIIVDNKYDGLEADTARAAESIFAAVA
jgi:CO dehydrogenase nickel-insertion accessory protein CooC1